MLLEFNMKNFKSFYDDTTISMIANNAQKEYTDRLMSVSDNKRVNKKALPSMVIYGPNASGKTSIIQAINTLKHIVINGTVKKKINNWWINSMDIYSFIHDIDKQREPIHLDIKFKTKNGIYSYCIEVIASFNMAKRKIIKEELSIISYKKEGSSVIEIKDSIFERLSDEVTLNKNKKLLNLLRVDLNIQEYYNEIIKLEKAFNTNLDDEDLFLTTGFKSMISLDIANDIVNWFENNLITIVDFTSMEQLADFDNKDVIIYENEMLEKLVRMSDFGPQKIVYKRNDNTGHYELNSLYKIKGHNTGIAINSKSIESKGTIKLVNFWVDFLEMFKKGGVFILDEFDCSIHPELIGGILDLFNNSDINVANAQLIFNTHNPLYLQKRFFRRDQIMFVEKDEETYISKVYKLSEFDIRNDKNYMKGYFEGRFGALPFIDFESAIEDV